MKKNLSSQSDNFSKKKTLKNFKKLFLHFSKNKFCFFLYIFKEPKYCFIFLDISTCLHEWSDSTDFEKKIMKYTKIICFYISKLKFSHTIIKYQIDTFWKKNYEYIIFEFRILFSKFLFLDFDFSKIIKTIHETKII